MGLNINERLIFFFDSLKLSYRQIEKNLGFSNGTIGKLKKGGSIGIDKMEKIACTYPEMNLNWLLRGTGSMLADTDANLTAEPQPVYDKNVLEMIRELSAENALLKKELEKKD